MQVQVLRQRLQRQRRAVQRRRSWRFSKTGRNAEAGSKATPRRDHRRPNEEARARGEKSNDLKVLHTVPL
jgi:hypothetical protein